MTESVSSLCLPGAITGGLGKGVLGVGRREPGKLPPRLPGALPYPLQPLPAEGDNPLYGGRGEPLTYAFFLSKSLLMKNAAALRSLSVVSLFDEPDEFDVVVFDPVFDPVFVDEPEGGIGGGCGTGGARLSGGR